MPVAKWLTGPLKPLVTDLLAPARLKRHGIFNADYVQILAARTPGSAPGSSQAPVDAFGF